MITLNQISKRLFYDGKKDFQERAKNFEKEYMEFYKELEKKWQCKYVLKIITNPNNDMARPTMAIINIKDQKNDIQGQLPKTKENTETKSE